MTNSSLQDRLFRVLLLLFPRDFRLRYGSDMEQLFRDRRRQIGSSPGKLLILWIQAILDIGSQAAAERVGGRRSASASESARRRSSKGVWGGLRSALINLRLSVRCLAKRPGYASLAVLTLALGIGAATAVFTLVDGVLIRPLPFPEPEELVSVQHLARQGQDHVTLSDGLYLLYREQAASVDEIALFDHVEMNLLVGEEPEQVDVQRVTPSFFPLLGAQAATGRTFLQEEELPGAPPVVVLSHGLWQRAFGSDPGALGRVFKLGGVDRMVVGIMPSGFGFSHPNVQAWVPYEVDPTQENLTNFSATGLARLAPGSTLQELNTEFQGLLDRLVAFFPEYGSAAFLADVEIQTLNVPAKEDLVGDVGPTLWILLGTVGFVLLIACANVASLTLVRAESRKRELAVRLAMGAGRWEIFRLFIGESLILAGAGGLLGLAVGHWALSTAIRFIPGDLPRVSEVGMDGRVLAFTALMTLGCALFCGFVPFARLAAARIMDPLKEGIARGSTSGRQSHQLRNGLVVGQVALALVLLVGAGLMFRSFLALREMDPGFDAEGILTARITVPVGEVESWQETAGLFRQLQERIASQPGVEAVGFTRRLPLSGSLGFTTVHFEDQAREPAGGYIVAHPTAAGPGYFETMGIPLVEGRTFQSDDAAEGVRAAIISESFARRWWPNESPLGHRLQGGGSLSRDWWQVVGVVADVRQIGLDEEVVDMIYLPPTGGLRAEPWAERAMDVVVKTSGPPLQFLPILRRELRALNPRIPLANPRTVHDVFVESTARTAFTMAILGSSAAIALLLGLVGVYGVISYVVSLRTREIGVRMALGATTHSVRKMMVLQGIRLVVTGSVIGLIAAGILSSFMGSLLFGVGTLDPGTYGGVTLALLTAAGLASWLPAHRATTVDPSCALREE